MEQIRRASKGALIDYVYSGKGWRVRAREELAARESSAYAKWALFIAALSLVIAVAAFVSTIGPTDVRVVEVAPDVVRSVRP